MRRLLVLSSAMVFLDVAFYAAVAPLLPDYRHDLHLSSASAGILSASYAAGTLVFSLPGGFIASQFGPRRSAVVGLGFLGASSLVFGLVHSIVVLDTARFVQGCAGAMIWTAAITWLLAAAAEERRGAVIGSVLGTAVAGALLGPALGALAGAIGTGVVFGAVFVFAGGLAVAAWHTDDPARTERQSPAEVWAALLSPPIARMVAFVVMPSLMFGAVEVLVPLRIDDLDGGHAVIAAGFIAGAGLEAVLAPLAGRFSDRAGRRSPYILGVSICAVAMVAVALAASLATVIGALILISLGAGICFSPAVTALSDLAADSGLHQAFAASLGNLAWSGGQVIGGVAGGAFADAAGFGATGIAIAVLLAFTVLYAFRKLEVDLGGAPAEAR